MSEYQLEIKQIVEYPRCRIYRQFIRNLMQDQSIRVGGCSGLFYFTVLCSYANFRTSYKRLDGISYTVYPGEWICRLNDVSKWFRTRFHYQAIDILDNLQKKKLITYTKLGHGKIIKFKINGWRYNNTILDYNAACQKDTGFFFLPIQTALELISSSKCSEMDIILDLWIHAIYNDAQVQGSDIGPVVYTRNGSGSPLLRYSELAKRWGISKATVGRVLKKLSNLNYLSLFSFPGRHGSVIYLSDYLSTMFQISDVMVDKQEVAMELNIKLSVPDSNETGMKNVVSEEQICVSKELNSVSKTYINILVQKSVQILATQGLVCCVCPKSIYKLSPLSLACSEDIYGIPYQKDKRLDDRHFILEITCGKGEKVFTFELAISPYKNHSLGGNGYE